MPALCILPGSGPRLYRHGKMRRRAARGTRPSLSSHGFGKPQPPSMRIKTNHEALTTDRNLSRRIIRRRTDHGNARRPSGGDNLTDDEWEKLNKFAHGDSSGTPAASSPADPGLEFLGMGYDVFDRYASVESCKRQILDFSEEPEVDQQVIDASLQLDILKAAFNTVPTEMKLIYKRPQKVFSFHATRLIQTTNLIRQSRTRSLNGRTHINLSGGFGPFAGEIDARFGSTLAKLATTKFYSLVSKSTYWHWALTTVSGTMPVRPEVQADLDNPSIDPADFFDEYGTHYLSSIAVGCRVTFPVRSRPRRWNRTSISART